MINCFIDIETIPDQSPGALDAFITDARESFKAPSSLTKEQAARDLGIDDLKEIKFTAKDEMIARWTERFAEEKAPELAEAEWRKTSFDGGRGEICTIAWALEDGPIQSIQRTPAIKETDFLIEFYCQASSSCDDKHRQMLRFIGHYVKDFDLRFLFQRSVICGVRPRFPLPHDARPGSDAVYDTMTAWAGYGNRISLDKLCGILGIATKGSEIGEEIDGSKVWDFYRDGRYSEIELYCKADVERVRQVYQRLTFSKGLRAMAAA